MIWRCGSLLVLYVLPTPSTDHQPPSLSLYLFTPHPPVPVHLCIVIPPRHALTHLPTHPPSHPSTQPPTHPHSHPTTRPTNYSLTHPFTHPFTCLPHSRTHSSPLHYLCTNLPYTHALTHPYLHAFTHPLIDLPFTPSLTLPFTHLPIIHHPFTYLPACSSTHPSIYFIHSFTCPPFILLLLHLSCHPSIILSHSPIHVSSCPSVHPPIQGAA